MTRNEAYEEFVFREGYKKGKADRPKGEWTIRFVEVENGMGSTYTERRWYCSACGKWQTYGETDFCPNCGADMRGEEDGH